MPIGFQSLLEQPYLGGTAHAIGAFDDDEFSLQLSRIYTRDSLAKEAKPIHVLIPVPLLRLISQRHLSHPASLPLL